MHYLHGLQSVVLYDASAGQELYDSAVALKFYSGCNICDTALAKHTSIITASIGSRLQ